MNDLSTQKNKRIGEVDYLRRFAVLAVIAIHTSSNSQILNLNLLLIVNLIIDVFSHFAVPLFIFISGFVLSLNYRGLFSQKTFYKKRAKSILPQYIIFSILYLLLNIIISEIHGNLEYPSIKTVIFYFLTAGSSYHLWYFSLIIQFYLFYPYIIKIYEKFVGNYETIFIFLALIAQQLWIVIKMIAINYINSSTHFSSLTYFISIYFVDRAFFSYIFYFILGIYLCRNYEYVTDKVFQNKKWIIVTIVVFTGAISALQINGIIKYGSYRSIPQSYFLVSNLLDSIYFPLIFSMLSIISLNIHTNKYKYSKYLNVFSLIGKYSFGIYLIHVLYITLIGTLIFPRLGIDPYHLIFYPVLFISVLILSYFSIYLISYLPYSKIIIGN